MFKSVHFLTIVSAAGLLLAGAVPAFCQSVANGTPAAERSAVVSKLQSQLAQQQKEIEQLRSALAEQRVLLQQVLKATKIYPASNPANPGPSASTEVASTARVIRKQPTSLSAQNESSMKAPARKVAANSSLPAGSTARQGEELVQGLEAKQEAPAPLSLRIGSAHLTLGGFADFTAMYRSTNVGGIGTQFGSIPYSNTPNGLLSETRFSAQNSRVKFKMTSKVGKTNVTGYLESDFLGVQPGSAYVTSNSNSLRMRLYWVDLQRGKFELLAGQSWSMLTPNRRGISPDPSDIFFTDDMDTNYQVGMVWTRAPQIRFVYHPNREWAAGLELENPEQYVGKAVTLPAGYEAQIDNGGNLSTPNVRPDLIGKIAYDPTIGGHRMHFEVSGVLRSFRLLNPATNSLSTVTGEGGSFNMNLELATKFRFILNSFYSDGGGRYIFGLGPDFIVRPDGSPSPVHSGSGLTGLEYRVRPGTMLFGYYGAAYYQRNYSFDPATGSYAGYGYPGSSTDANRSIQEGTIGFTETLWKAPRYGALEWINQYSYVTRNPWSVSAATPKNAHTNMVYTDLRYVLP